MQKNILATLLATAALATVSMSASAQTTGRKDSGSKPPVMTSAEPQMAKVQFGGRRDGTKPLKAKSKAKSKDSSQPLKAETNTGHYMGKVAMPQRIDS